MKASISKGVYNLNPTKAVMKLGGEQQREANRAGPVREDGPRVPEAHESGADIANLGSAMSSKRAFGEQHNNDFYGVENQVHHTEHPMMQTRSSHPKERKHADGRKHEDHHHAVRKAKGK